ncbi:amino acid ABC transporter permease [Streptacidiphilus fuscans]|uniref:Amino acid ABC transporter permease n=1 Tax=Streptacidiphilus fuscans TaxID=2789292 RepID=A0A931B4R1_9ACTN|nr:amino acid ABC transporter permease [Streptacidiphilus fuscans]MBF9070181.1 amino acid ABC transporter permease [Streptacidiphilus fuscans]
MREGTDAEASAYVPSQRRLEREAYRRSRARRSALIAGGSTVAVAAVLAVVITGSPGWPVTRTTFFSGHYARQAISPVLHGFVLNLELLAVCGPTVLVLGLLIAALRTLRGPVFLPVRLLATAYVDFFRGFPLVILMLLVVFGVPALQLQGVTNDPIVLGGAALVICYSAYVAEVFRAGIESVHPSQRAAARSLGLGYAQTMRFVVLPQAIRRVVPALVNDMASLQKDTGLVYLGGAIDAVAAAHIMVASSFNYTPLVLAGLGFVILTIPMTRYADWLTRRMDNQRAQGGVV